MATIIDTIDFAAGFLRDALKGRSPEVGIILGSGLGALADDIADPAVIPYRDIPGFPVSTAIGHKGNFVCGTLGGKCVLAMQGRFHYYEGYPMETVTLPIRVMSELGIKYLMVSNAAGGVNSEFEVGDLMIIRDHINLMPNPLIGPNLAKFGPRFPDMTRPYDPELIRRAKDTARRLGIQVHSGVYLASTGPTYETPAEYNFYRIAGADAVGMSTIPEIIVARHCGIPCFGMSVITNASKDLNKLDFANDGDDVVNVANNATRRMTRLFTAIIEDL